MTPRIRAAATFTVLLATVVGHSSFAVSLRPNKATDNSICDLGPNTTEGLTRLAYVSAEASHEDQVEAIVRIGSSFVTSKCSNGQILILHGKATDRLHTGAMERLSNSLCTASSVTRTSVPYVSSLNRSSEGFELRCPISKLV